LFFAGEGTKETIPSYHHLMVEQLHLLQSELCGQINAPRSALSFEQFSSGEVDT
jgi:hypothetical protein